MTAIAARCRTLLAGFASAATLVAPATAGAATAAGGAGCPDVAVGQPFAAWGDTADYFLAPDGDFEGDGDSWVLRGGARVTGGDASPAIGSPADARSLRLPAGSAATSAPFCIGVEHRSLRFLARAARSSSLHVDVLYTDARGKPRSKRLGRLAGARGWAPTGVVPMVVNTLAAARGNAMTVRLRIAPRGAGAWSVDDVYIDPYRVR